MNIPNSLFKNLMSIGVVPIRSFNENLPKPIKYYGFKYYPRHENFQDPPYTPSKLFFIKRIKSMKGRTKMEKKTLSLLNIDGEVDYDGHINIVKNIPEINTLLWKVKHLVMIKPIKWKGELPKDDFTGTHLRETGEFIISPRLKVNKEEIESTQKYIQDKNILKPFYLREYLRKKWENAFSGKI